MHEDGVALFEPRGKRPRRFARTARRDGDHPLVHANAVTTDRADDEARGLHCPESAVLPGLPASVGTHRWSDHLVDVHRCDGRLVDVEDVTHDLQGGVDQLVTFRSPVVEDGGNVSLEGCLTVTRLAARTIGCDTTRRDELAPLDE